MIVGTDHHQIPHHAELDPAVPLDTDLVVLPLLIYTPLELIGFALDEDEVIGECSTLLPVVDTMGTRIDVGSYSWISLRHRLDAYED